jgi:DtxR family Mn-dependent transcriptional regulator
MARSRTTRPEDPHLTRLERLSPAAENYLLCLYVFWEEDVRVTLVQLAEAVKKLPESEGLGTSLPSVAGMVRRLMREGLVVSGGEKVIRLTETGFPRAEDMVRRHRLAERLVVDVLGVDLPMAHIEAHRLEHAISPLLLGKIAERLDNPTTCPFGRPIPGSAYQSPTTPSITMDKARPGQFYVVDRMPEESEELVRFLVDSQIIPGRRVSVLEAAAYRGVISVDVDGNEASVSYEVASRIQVRPA